MLLVLTSCEHATPDAPETIDDQTRCTGCRYRTICGGSRGSASLPMLLVLTFCEHTAQTRRKPSTIRRAAPDVVIGPSAAARAGVRPYQCCLCSPPVTCHPGRAGNHRRSDALAGCRNRTICGGSRGSPLPMLLVLTSCERTAPDAPETIDDQTRCTGCRNRTICGGSRGSPSLPMLLVLTSCERTATGRAGNHRRSDALHRMS